MNILHVWIMLWVNDDCCQQCDVRAQLATGEVRHSSRYRKAGSHNCPGRIKTIYSTKAVASSSKVTKTESYSLNPGKMLPASLMTRWNSLFLHTLTHGQGWVGGVGMMTFLSLAHMWHATHLTFLALAHMWHATQVMGRVGWVGWGWWRFYHLHTYTCDMLRTWRFLHLHTCDICQCFHNKMQFTKWHSKTRLTGTQALDKVWSQLEKHVPKSLCSRSKSDRRFNPRMEQ